MKIGKKIFTAILSTCLIITIFIELIFVLMLNLTNSDISSYQETKSKNLSSDIASNLTQVNQDHAKTAAVSYCEYIYSNLQEYSNTITLLKQCLYDFYKNPSVSYSKYPDDFVYLQANTSMTSVQSEFNKIKQIRDIMSSVPTNSSYSNIYYMSETGILLTPNTVDSASVSSIDLRTKAWYTRASELKGTQWTTPYVDLITGKLVMTCSTPVIHDDNSVAGVVAIDVMLGDICDSVLNTNSKNVLYAFLINKQGDFLLGNKVDEKLSDIVNEKTYDKIITTMTTTSDEPGSIIVDNTILGYAPAANGKWVIGVILDYEHIMQPINIVDSSINDISQEITNQINSKILYIILITLLVIVIATFVIVYSSKRVSSSITIPIEKLDKGAKLISKGNLNHVININTKDELQDLSESFNLMAENLKSYIDNLRQITADREKIQTELNVANHIQASMLPCIFPPFPKIKSVDIYAIMDPAKEVGGDFYDFFAIDDNTIGFVIADVSGKGVPAALFMVIAKTMIKNYTQAKMSPEQVFEYVNNKLCENNKEEMFVTSFMGTLNIKTGEFTYVNAGHNPPLLKKKDGTFEYLNIKKGFVLAGIEKIKYKQQTMKLNQGDILYMYTDGVVEAQNNQNQLYSEKRLADHLNSINAETEPLKNVLDSIMTDVNNFVDGAPQFDDITMLIIRKNL